MPKLWLIGLAAAFGALATYLVFCPVAINPAPWSPPDPPALVGPYAPNEALADVERLDVGLGPESVTVSIDGAVTCGLEDGSIVRRSPGSAGAARIADIGGRPLGMAYDASGELVVCDLYGRLLAVSETGGIRELVTDVDGGSRELLHEATMKIAVEASHEPTARSRARRGAGILRGPAP